MTTILCLALAAMIGLGALGLVVHGIVETARNSLWPRGLRWFPGAWLGASARLHRLVLRAFWPEKVSSFKSLALLDLESLDQQWRTWNGCTGSDGVPLWVPEPGRTTGHWVPRQKPKPLCPCGYGDECGVHCGSGHTTGACEAEVHRCCHGQEPASRCAVCTAPDVPWTGG
jgi:hypothetical protein